MAATDDAAVVPCKRCGTVDKLPRAVLCDACSEAWEAERREPRAERDDGGFQGHLEVTTADLSLARPPRWGWQDRLVIGSLNIILGEEGLGKGVLLAWLTSRLTHGELPGDLHGRPVNVAIIGDEDSFNSVWVPRLYANGANLDRVIHITRPDTGYVDLSRDREELRLAIAEQNIRVLICDQLLDNLPTGTDVFKQKAVRDAVLPISSLAEECDQLTLGVLHPNKHGGTFRELMNGTGLNQVARSGLYLARHPDDEDRRLLCHGKGNLARDSESVDFKIESCRFEANGFHFNVPRAVDFKASDLRIADLVSPDERRQEHSRIADACEIVEALLPKDGEWHPAKPLKEACADEGIEDHLVKRAKERLGIEHRRTSTFPAVTEWRWPASQNPVSTSSDTVPTAPTVPTVNPPKPLREGSWNTQDSKNSQRGCTDCAPTGANLPSEPRTDREDDLDDAADHGSSKQAERARRWAEMHPVALAGARGAEL